MKTESSLSREQDWLCHDWSDNIERNLLGNAAAQDPIRVKISSELATTKQNFYEFGQMNARDELTAH